MEKITIQLKPFFEPKSVAVIGAPFRMGEATLDIVGTLIQLGYEGTIYPVYPQQEEVWGIKVFPSLEEVPRDVDLAVISTRRMMAPALVSECVERGIKAIVITGQGFTDAADKEGKRLQEEVVQIARRGGARVVGPNSIGTANPFFNFSTSFAIPFDMEKLPIGLICQSGMFFGSFHGIKFLGKGIDVGNACDVDLADCLEFFAHDDEVKLIVLHIEGVHEGKRFLEVAARVARKKPVIALKTGKSELAATRVLSHTGSLTGREEVWDAALRQSGIMRARDIEEMGDLVEAFLTLPMMRGRRVGVLSLSGGMGVLTMDACERFGLETAELLPETRQKLGAMYPSWFDVGNPVDIWPAMIVSGIPPGEVLHRGLEALLGDPGVDGALVIAGAWLEILSPSLSDILSNAAAAFPSKPVAWWPYEGWVQKVHIKEIERKVRGVGGVAVFRTPERAINAFSKLAQYWERNPKSQS